MRSPLHPFGHLVRVIAGQHTQNMRPRIVTKRIVQAFGILRLEVYLPMELGHAQCVCRASLEGLAGLFDNTGNGF